MGDKLRSAQTDQVAGDTPMPGGSFEKFDIGSPVPKLESAQWSVAFEMSTGEFDMDIPGGLMTCMTVPEQSGSNELDTAQGTPQIGGK